MAVYQIKDKNGKIKKDKNGYRWWFRCYYTDIYGHRKQKNSKSYASKSLAIEAERNFLNNVDNAQYEDSDINFSALYNEWLNYKNDLIKVTTYYRLKKTINIYIYDYFKDYKLSAIKLNVLINWKNWLKTFDIGLDYQNKIIGNMKEILNYAKDIYNYNGAIISKLTKNRVEASLKVKNSKLNFWTYDEFKQFISVVNDRYYYIIFYFMYFTGVRIGELIALTWNDIDLDRKKLRIYKSFSNKVEGKEFIITDPKTANSIRTVDLADNVTTLLKELYESESKIYDFSKDMFIFGNVKHLSQTTLTRYLKKYCLLASVKPITLHGFRHSHVSFLINIGCNSREVAARVGDTLEMIENTYIHIFPEKKNDLVEKMNNFKM